MSTTQRNHVTIIIWRRPRMIYVVILRTFITHTLLISWRGYTWERFLR